MKKLLYFSLIVAVTLNACSKKNNDPKPQSISISGNSYSTVVIGNLTWTSVNYNGPGGTNYDDSVKNNPAFGKLYTMKEAKAIALPTGWRLPTYADYLNLVVTLGAKQVSPAKQDMNAYEIPTNTVSSLMSKTGWADTNGINSSGFTAIPAGFYFSDHYSGTGYQATFMIPTDDLGPIVFGIISNGGPLAGITDINTFYGIGADYRCSIRFVRNN
jgi:uncharacterized protein (TIGR02145 family)